MSTPRTKTARTLKTEAAILSALSELMTQMPIAKISLTALSKTSGLTRSTVYNQMTSVSNALNMLSLQLWNEFEQLAHKETSLPMKIFAIIDWVATDARIQGFRKHNAEEFLAIISALSRLDDDSSASRVTEILLSWSVAADLDTATTLTRWIASWAFEPGTARERESASELFAQLLVRDVKS